MKYVLKPVIVDAFQYRGHKDDDKLKEFVPQKKLHDSYGRWERHKELISSTEKSE